MVEFSLRVKAFSAFALLASKHKNVSRSVMFYSPFWYPISTRLCFVFSLIFALPLLGHGQTLDSNPIFDVGDKWTYRFHDTGNRKEPYLFTNQAYKSEGGSGWIYSDSQEIGARRKHNIQRYDYKRADTKERFAFNAKNPTEPGTRYSNTQPNDDNIQLPLTVGKKYTVKLNWGNGEGNTKYDAEVEAFEKVKVEAGEFEAYRIKLSGYWTRTSNGNYSGRAGHTIYFAPSVKRFVKWTYFERNSDGSPWGEETTELVKWEPKAELASALVVPVVATPPAAVVPQ